MHHKVTRVHPDDNVLVALANLPGGENVTFEGDQYTVIGNVAAKHKFAMHDMQPAAAIIMYGVLVGRAQQFIPRGGLITTANVKHAAQAFEIRERQLSWQIPDVSKFRDRFFWGYHRSDGKVGTANYWLVIPMVFCENRNLEVLQEALVNELGYGRNQNKKAEVARLIDFYKSGKTIEDILKVNLQVEVESIGK